MRSIDILEEMRTMAKAFEAKRETLTHLIGEGTIKRSCMDPVRVTDELNLIIERLEGLVENRPQDFVVADEFYFYCSPRNVRDRVNLYAGRESLSFQVSQLEALREFLSPEKVGEFHLWIDSAIKYHSQN